MIGFVIEKQGLSKIEQPRGENGKVLEKNGQANQRGDSETQEEK